MAEAGGTIVRFLFIVLFMLLTTHTGAQEAQGLVAVQGNHTAPAYDESKPNAQNGGEEISEYWALLGHRLKITDSLLVVFTLLLFFATVALWWSTRRLVQGADKTAERQLRAYISVDSQTNSRQSKNQLFHFYLTIVNNGLTPANEVRILSNVEILSNPIVPIGFDYSMNAPPAGTGLASVTSMSPRQMMRHTTIGTRLSSQQLRELVRGKLFFHVRGRVSYEDMFSHSRVTNFSFVIFVAPDKRRETVWHRTEEHNNSS
ncbi:hypothetical protein [Mesorhizobium sp. M0435]|uniref:hypothetical protein n=1 Tax=unclassified Mesorhizobium TaxID=325217 RepID=UPI00333582B3